MMSRDGYVITGTYSLACVHNEMKENKVVRPDVHMYYKNMHK